MASIASQIYSYASNIQSTINLLEQQFDSLESQTRNIGRKIQLNNEKCSRREIGRLTKSKRLIVQPPVIYPERPKIRTTYKYQQDSIDFSSLDNVGVAYKIHQQHDKSNTFDNRSMLPTIKSATLRPSKSSNLSSIIASQPSSLSSSSSSSQSNTGQSSLLATNEAIMYGRTTNNALISTIRPSTPPTSGAGMFNSLARHSKDSYRSGMGFLHHHPTPLVIPPPQVPPNYASNKQDLQTQPQPQLSTKSCVQHQQQDVSTTGNNNDKPNTANDKSSSQQTEQVKIERSLVLDKVETSVGSSSPASQDWIPSNYLEKGKHKKKQSIRSIE